MRTSSDPLPSDHDSVDCLGCVPRPLCVPPHVSPLLSKAVLPNGLRVFLLEDHEVPLVRGTLVMRGGRYASPQDKVRGVLVMRGGRYASPQDKVRGVLVIRGGRYASPQDKVCVSGGGKLQ